MKKLMNLKWLLMVVLMLSLTTVEADAQRSGSYLACTGNNVNIRKGPGKQYSVVTLLGWDEERLCDGRFKQQLYKGERVKYLGKKKNGFLYIEFYRAEEGGYTSRHRGWVSADYLR